MPCKCSWARSSSSPGPGRRYFAARTTPLHRPYAKSTYQGEQPCAVLKLGCDVLFMWLSCACDGIATSPTVPVLSRSAGLAGSGAL